MISQNSGLSLISEIKKLDGPIILIIYNNTDLKNEISSLIKTNDVKNVEVAMLYSIFSKEKPKLNSIDINNKYLILLCNDCEPLKEFFQLSFWKAAV